MSAAARAEARRKAILSRGTDRLSKLTSSARGDDPAYQNAPAPSVPRRTSTTSLRTESFLGEDAPIGGNGSPLRPPAFRADSEPPPSFAAATNPFAQRDGTPEPGPWSQEQQDLLLRALMGGAGVGGSAFPALPDHPPPGYSADSVGDPPLPNLNGMDMNPLAAFLGQQGGFPQGPQPVPEQPKPKSFVQKILPILHIITTWMLLIYFALFYEPRLYETNGGMRSWSERWAMLLKGETSYGFEVLTTPFFYAFATTQIILHSTRIFVGYGSVQPPMLLSLVLPHLPPPIPSIILQGMKYFKMGGAILDDLSMLLVSIGIGVWLLGYFV